MKKYLLLNTVRDKSGNVYYARTAPYVEGELPKECINPLNVKVIEDDTQQVIFKSSSQEQEVRQLNEPTTITTNLVPKFVDSPTVVDKINVNEVSLDSIKSLKGIGEKTATLLVSNRPYSNVQELTSKVKPPLGKSWEEFNFSFQSES